MLSPCLCHHSSTQSLGSNHAQAANEAANAQINQHAPLAISRTSPESNKRTAQHNHSRITQEARRNNKLLHLLDILRRALRRRIHHNDDRAHDTHEAANLAHKAQPFLQKDRRQDRRNDDRQRPQRRHQDRIHERVGHEITHLAEDHERHAGPPVEVLEVAVALAGLLVVFDVGAQQADFLQHEGDADEDARGDGEGNTDRFVGRGPRVGLGTGTAAGVVGCAGEKLVAGGEEGGGVEGHGLGFC